MWVLRLEPESSARITSVLDHRAISLAPSWLLKSFLLGGREMALLRTQFGPLVPHGRENWLFWVVSDLCKYVYALPINKSVK